MSVAVPAASSLTNDALAGQLTRLAGDTTWTSPAERAALLEAASRLAAQPDLTLRPASPGWQEPACPADGSALQDVLYRQVHHFRCPRCRIVYYKISGQVGDARGRIPARQLRSPEGTS